MKYFIIILLFSCNFMTAMHNFTKQPKKQTILLENVTIKEDGNRVVALAQIKGSKEKFFVEQDTKNNTSYCFHMKPVSEQTPGFNTQGVVYIDETNNRPEIHSAIKREINNYQNQTKPSLKNTEPKALKNTKTKRSSLRRRASRIFK